MITLRELFLFDQTLSEGHTDVHERPKNMPDNLTYAYKFHDDTQRWEMTGFRWSEDGVKAFASRVKILARHTFAAYEELKEAKLTVYAGLQKKAKNLVSLTKQRTDEIIEFVESRMGDRDQPNNINVAFGKLDGLLYACHGVLDMILGVWKNQGGLKEIKWNWNVDHSFSKSSRSIGLKYKDKIPEELFYAYDLHDQVKELYEKIRGWDDKTLETLGLKIISVARAADRAVAERRTFAKSDESHDMAKADSKIDDIKEKCRALIDKAKSTSLSFAWQEIFVKLDDQLYFVHGLLDTIRSAYRGTSRQVHEGWSQPHDRPAKMPPELDYAYKLHDRLKEFEDRISYKMTEKEVKAIGPQLRALARSVMAAAEETGNAKIIHFAKKNVDETLDMVKQGQDVVMNDTMASYWFVQYDTAVYHLHDQLDSIMTHYKNEKADKKKYANLESVSEKIDDEPLDPDEVQFQDDPRIMYMLKKGSPVPAYPQDALRIKTSDTEKFRDDSDDEKTEAAEPSVKGKDYFQFAYETPRNGETLSCRAVTRFTGDWFSSPTFIELKKDGKVVKTVQTTRKGAKKVWRDFVDGKSV